MEWKRRLTMVGIAVECMWVMLICSRRQSLFGGLDSGGVAAPGSCGDAQENQDKKGLAAALFFCFSSSVRQVQFFLGRRRIVFAAWDSL